MTKTQMPEPTAEIRIVGNVTIFDLTPVGKQQGLSVGQKFITTDQAEAYAEARVRVALEEAASIARENYLAAYAGRVGVDEDDNDDRNTEIFNVGQVAQALAYSKMEEAIRALIHTTK